MIHQLHLKTLVVTFYWIIQSSWKDWKKWGAMEPLLSPRNIQKMMPMPCAPNAACCVLAKGPDASLSSSDVEGLVST